MSDPVRAAFAVILTMLLLAEARAADESRISTVGMPARVEQLVLPGPELEVKPIDDLKTPLVVRITEIYAHGSAFRYDLVYYGLKPGTYDLASFLKRKDGTPATGLPQVPVTIQAALPPGQIEPHPLASADVPRLGGYWRLVELLGMLWSVGLVLIIYLTRRRAAAAAAALARPLTLAERLRPLVEAAVAGTLAREQYAELERLLIGYWRRRAGLEHDDPAVAVAALRQHPEAGPAFRQLEDWLHRPGGAAAVDVAALLRPYHDIPIEADLEGEPATARHSA